MPFCGTPFVSLAFRAPPGARWRVRAMPVHVVTSEGVRARAARRGVTLVEAILYLSVSFSVITFTAQTLVPVFVDRRLGDLESSTFESVG